MTKKQEIALCKDGKGGPRGNLALIVVPKDTMNDS